MASLEIFNSDQGSQFSEAFTSTSLRRTDAISMDGKGSWRDNVFVEGGSEIGEVRGGLPQGLRHRRSARFAEPVPRLFQSSTPYLSLDRKTPDEAYFTPRPSRPPHEISAAS